MTVIIFSLKECVLKAPFLVVDGDLSFIIEKTYYEDDEMGDPIRRYYIKRDGEELSSNNLMFFIDG